MNNNTYMCENFEQNVPEGDSFALDVKMEFSGSDKEDKVFDPYRKLEVPKCKVYFYSN